jgi:hypothetical protein
MSREYLRSQILRTTAQRDTILMTFANLACLILLIGLGTSSNGVASAEESFMVEHPECRLFLAESTIPNGELVKLAWIYACLLQSKWFLYLTSTKIT